jgi:hypothetical protein
MLKWLSSLFKVPQPSGPPQTIRTFRATDPTIARSGVSTDQGGWLIDAKERQTYRLFEVEAPSVDQCVITYRAKMKAQNLTGRAFLEMWCRFPGRGEFFSKGLQHALRGTTEWASYETPFYLKKGQKPDLIKLNVAVEGTGKIWIKDIELLSTPLSA